ncbi:hypothetical protein D3C80_677130 [compost metagenome]
MHFLGEKKAQQSHKDCVWHISSFIVTKFFSHDELEPEKPNGDQTFIKSLSCIEIDFDSDCQ